MSEQPRRRELRGLRRLVVQWPAVVVLAIIWVMLWGDLSWANVLAGLGLGIVLVLVFPLPPIASDGRFRLVPFLSLAVRFVWDLFLASFEVAWIALRPGASPRGAVVKVQLRNPDDVFLTATAVLSTLVPGSLVVETRRRTGEVFLHVLDIEGSGGADGVRADIQLLEERLLRAFAGNAVLERYGISARPRKENA